MQWKPVGQLNGKTVWRNQNGQLAIEREFERLCELSAQELAQWEEQGTAVTERNPLNERRLPDAPEPTRRNKSVQSI